MVGQAMEFGEDWEEKAGDDDESAVAQVVARRRMSELLWRGEDGEKGLGRRASTQLIQKESLILSPELISAGNTDKDGKAGRRGTGDVVHQARSVSVLDESEEQDGIQLMALT